MKSANSLGFCFLVGQRKQENKKTKRFRYVRGGMQTLICPHTVHRAQPLSEFRKQLNCYMGIIER